MHLEPISFNFERPSAALRPRRHPFGLAPAGVRGVRVGGPNRFNQK